MNHRLACVSQIRFLFLFVSALVPAWAATPSFVGSTTTLSVTQNTSATSIKALLHASDTDASQTLTWSQSTAPAHGSLWFANASAASGSADITPGGVIVYTPTAGYTGSDSFVVSVTDGAASATRTITVTVNADTTAPALLSSAPAHQAVSVATNANILLNFNERVKAGTGNIIVRPTGGSDITIPVSSSQVAFVGAAVFINPTADLAASTEYQVIVGSGVVQDLANRPFAGIASGALRFSTRASARIFNADGIGTHADVAPKPLGSAITMKSYGTWPAAVTPGGGRFEGSAFDGRYFWLAPYSETNVVRVDMRDGSMTAFGTWPAGFDKTDSFSTFLGAVFDGEYIWLLPYQADRLVRIHRQTGAMTGFADWPVGFTKTGSKAFAGGAFDGRYIWMPPRSANPASPVVRVDTLTGEMVGYSDFPAGTTAAERASFNGAVFDGSKIWLVPFTNGTRVFSLDPQTGAITKHNFPTGWPTSGFTFATGVFDGQNIWLVPDSADRVVKIDKDTGAMTGYSDWPAGFTKSGKRLIGAAFDGQSIWMSPFTADRVIKIDKDTGVMTGYNNWPGDLTSTTGFFGGGFDGQSVWLAPFNNTKFVRLSDDAIAPAVSAIARHAPLGESLSAGTASVTFRITFSEGVTGLDAADLTLSGPVTGTIGTPAEVSGSAGAQYDVAVTALSGAGSLRLDLKDTGTGIADFLSNAIASGFTTGQSYTLAAPDAVAPTFASSTPAHNDTGVAVGGNIVLTFSENVVAGTGNLILRRAGASDIAISVTDTTQVTFSDQTVTINPGADLAFGGGFDLIIAAGVIKDTAGNSFAGFVAGQMSFTTSGAPETQPPVIVSVVRQSPAASASAATSITWRVTFSENVTGVNASQFATSGTPTGTLSVNAVTGSVYDVTLSAISGIGSVRLDVKPGVVKDLAGNFAAGFWAGEAYTVLAAADTAAPAVSSIARLLPTAATARGADVLLFRVIFSEAVTGVDLADFELTFTGNAAGTVAGMTAVGDKTFHVGVRAVSGTGTVRLDVKATGTGIVDLAGNALAGGFTTGVTFSIAPNEAGTTSPLVTRQPGLPSQTSMFSSANPVVSYDGRFVIYGSVADDTIIGMRDTRDMFHLFLADRSTNSAALISHSETELTSGYGNLSPTADYSISDDGRFVAWVASAYVFVDGVTDNSTTANDILLFDRTTGVNTLVSHTASSLVTAASGESRRPILSADGNYLVFLSKATNMVSGGSDSNGTEDVFLYERSTGTISLVSHSSSGFAIAAHVPTGSNLPQAAISADGRYVAFLSHGTNLIAGATDTGTAADIFLYDRTTRTNVLVSHTSDNPKAFTNGATSAPSLSADGSIVVHDSTATNLQDGVTSGNAGSDVYYYRRDTDKNVLVSHASAQPMQEANASSHGPIVSRDGRTIAYYTNATDLVASQTGPASLGVAISDLASNKLVTHAPGAPATGISSAPSALSLSADGRYLTWMDSSTALVSGVDANQSSDVFLYDRDTGAVSLLSHAAGNNANAGNGASSAPIVTADGRWAFWHSTSSDVVNGLRDYNANLDVFATRISDNTATAAMLPPLPRADAEARFSTTASVVSADGRYGLLLSPGYNLTSAPGSPHPQALLHDAWNGTLKLASHRNGSPNVPANAEVATPALSLNGRYLVYTTEADNLGFTDSGGTDVFLYDVETAATQLVSHTASAANTAATAESAVHPFLSGDGNWVVYGSAATNLVAGQVDTASTTDLFLYERATGINRLITHLPGNPTQSAGGNSAELPPSIAAISDDGRFVAFFSANTNLVSGQVDANEFRDLFLYDRNDGTIRLITRSHTDATGATVANATTSSGALASMSADGAYLVFATYAQDVMSGITDAANNTLDVFLYERATDTFKLVTHSSTNPTTTAQTSNVRVAISPDGRYVAFSGSVSPYVPGGSLGGLLLYDRVTDTFSIGSPRATGALAGISGTTQVMQTAQPFSNDGRYLVFQSTANNLVPGQVDPSPVPVPDYFVFDRVTGTTRLLNHTAGTLAAVSEVQPSTLQISRDGSTLYFSNFGTDLADIRTTVNITNVYRVGSVQGTLFVRRVLAPANNSYATDAQLTFTVEFSAPVTVTGTPRLALTIGSTTRYATYTATGSTATSLKFSYTVQADDADSNGIAVATPIELNGGTLQDGAGASIALGFTAPNTTSVLVVGGPPTLVSSTPTDNAANVASTDDIVLTFSEAVVAGTGDIVLRPATGSDITIPIGDPQVTFSTNTVTINPTADLAAGMEYDVIIASGVIKDASATAFAGLAADALDFTTAAMADTTAPTLVSRHPEHNATDVSTSTNIVLDFSEHIVAGTGSIILRPSSGSDVTIALNDAAQLWVIGTTLTLDPAVDLLPGRTYDVIIPSGAIKDEAGNVFAGLSSGALRFHIAGAAPTIATHPQSKTVAGLQSTSLTVAASGTAPFTYQWFKDDVALEGQVFPTLTLPYVLLKDAGAYKVKVTNAVGEVTSDAATLVVAPYVLNSSPDRSVGLGGKQRFFVSAAGSGTLTYQWRKGGEPIDGATSAEYEIPAVALAHAGSYDVVIGHSASSTTTTSSATTLTVLPNPIVYAAQATVAGADGVAGYFSIEGTQPKKLVIAAFGPALIFTSGAISDPQIVIESATGASIATNDNWGAIEDTTFSATYTRLGLTPVASGSKDAIVYRSFPAGSYRVRITGVGGATGVVGFVIADADLNPSSRLAYVALRGPVADGTALTGGFTIRNSAEKKLLLRAIGPTLGSSGLADPSMKVFDSDGTTVAASDDNWGGGSALADAFTQAGAFALPADSKDAAVLGARRIGTGSYTAQVTGAAGTRGDVLWEVYDLNGTAPSTSAPIIIAAPASQSVTGGNVTFHVLASGGGPVIYKWKKGTTVIEGASTATLTLNNVTSADAADYTVEVGNNAGIASASASLHHIPSISSVTGPTAASYKAGTTLGFTVTFNGNVTVTGVPRLALTIGSATVYAVYTATGSTSSSLVFNYTVAAGDNDADGIAGAGAIDLNGGAIKDSANNNVGLTFTAPTLTSVLVDTTAPTVALASTVTGPTRLASIPLTITFSENVTGFTAEDLAVSGAVAGNFTGSGKTYAADLTSSGDGTITVDLAAAKAEDVAGNGNTAATQFSIVSDRTAPGAPTIVGISDDTGASSSDRITYDRTLSFRGTAEPKSSIALTWVGGSGVIGTTTADVAGNWSVDASATTLATGELAFTAKATDAAGNESAASASFGVTIDITAPTVSLASSATSPTRGNPVPLTITFSEPVADFTLDDLAVTGGTAGSLTGSGASYSVSITPAGDGTITVNLAAAKAHDAAGNDNIAATPLSIVYDGTAPLAPVIASISTDTGSSSSDGITSDRTLSFTGSAEANSTVELFRGGMSIGTTPANNSGAWTFDYTGTPLTDDDYSFSAKAKDAAGNVGVASSTFMVTVDTIAPAVPAIAAISDDTGASSTDLITSDPTLVLSGTAESGSTVTITRIGTGVLGSTKVGKSGTWSYDYTGTTLGAGEHSFTASAADAAGNTSTASAALIVTVDTATATPAIASISADSGKSGTDGITNDNTLTLAGTAEANSTVTLTRSGATAPIGTVTANASGAWTFDYTATTLADASYIFNASATDTAGNTSATSADFPVVIDTTAPSAPVIAGIATDSGASATDRITNDTTLALSGTAEAGAQVELFLGTTSLGTFAADATTGAWSFDYSATTLAEGTHLFVTKATDAAGNTSAASADFVVTVDTTAPAITSATSASGTYKSPFTFTVVASGAAQFAASGLPAGLAIDAASGVIAGTPSESGSFSVSLTATDAAGNSSTGTLAITLAKINLTVAGVTALDKAYDGSVNATLNLASATLAGVVSGDDVTLVTSGATGAFADAGAGGGKPVTIAGLALSGSHASHYTLTQPTAAANITRAPVTITISNLSHVYDGSAKSPSVSVAPAIAHRVNVGGAAMINAGSYSVTVEVTDSNYAGWQAATLTIAKATQTVTLSAPATGKLGTPGSVSATASSGLPVALAVSGSAALSGSTLTFSAPGTVTITATQAGNENYAAATATATVTVAGKLTQTIAFGAPGDRLSNSGSFTLNATATSKLPVTFAIISGPAMLSGSTVTLTGAAGQVVVRASQPGNDVYEPAPDVAASFTVTAATLNVFFGTVTQPGNPAKAGDVAATLPPNSNQGSLLVVAPGMNVNTVLDFTLNPDGTFTQTIIVDAPTSGSDVPNTPARAAASVTLTITGSLVNGWLQGVIQPLGLTFSANVLPVAGPSANAAGLYKSSTLANTNGSTYSIVGTNNEVLVLAKTPEVTTGGLTTLNADGTFGLQTTTSAGTATIRGTVDEPTTTVAGTISLPGRPDTSFAGLVVTTTRTDRLVNLSSRVRIGGGDRVLITGFVIGGAESKQVLVRGIGPGLAGFGVQGALANPRIRLYRDGQLIAENDDWTGAAASELAPVFNRLGAFALGSASADAALLATLPPGAYTAQVLDSSGQTASSGVALAEIYDASVNPNSEYQRLVNISTRGEAGTGENVLIGGFIVTGNSPKKMLIRGIGPGLAAFGVAGTLADPRLRVFRGSEALAENDNWSAGNAEENATIADAARATGAFALPAGSRDAALILTLAPGQYTAQVSPNGSTVAGVALVEIYEIPE